MKTQTLIIGAGGALAVGAALLFSNRANASELGTGPVNNNTNNGDSGSTTAPVQAPTEAPKPSVTAPRGIRNNNPGNIKKSSAAWVGKIGNDGTFETFDTAENGIRAMARLLRTYRNNYGLNTIRGIISRWTSGDSSTIQNNYVYHIVDKTGIAEHAQMYSEQQYAAVVEQMIYFENGQQPYSKSLILKAVQNGFA